MNISFDLEGCYWEHKVFFDDMAKGMQKLGHKVGIIAGERAIDPFSGKDRVEELKKDLGFKPDFIHLWGENETISNGNLWKVEKIVQEEVLVHFDDDATELKKYTDRWIIKTLNSGELGKF